MIHRFVDLDRVLELDIPILVLQTGATTERAIWKIGNGLTPVRMDQTAVSSLGTPQTNLGDPHREPVTGDSVVYSRFTTTGTITREVRLVDWADTTDTQLYLDASGPVGDSLQPQWAPDGSKVVFRAKGSGSNLSVIKNMDPDGTNVQTLYTQASGNTVFHPSYSFDGSKLAWVEFGGVVVSNADGSSATVEFAATGDVAEQIAWQQNANVLAFRHLTGGNEIWKVMNDDGTGLATWLSISRSGYGPGEGNSFPIDYTWTADDKIAALVRATADPDPDNRLGLIDSGGLTYITPARYGGTNAPNYDQRPCAITGRSEGVERIYWFDGLTVPVASVLPDGSDYRVDFNVANTAFHGFRGDTVNV